MASAGRSLDELVLEPAPAEPDGEAFELLVLPLLPMLPLLLLLMLLGAVVVVLVLPICVVVFSRT